MTDIEHILATASFVDAEARAECERRIAAAMAQPVEQYDELLEYLDSLCDTVPDEAAAAIHTLSKRIAELEQSDASWKESYKYQTKVLVSRAEAAESRLAAIDAYRGEADDVLSKLYDDDGYSAEDIKTALLAARMEGAEAEREACAKICDEYDYASLAADMIRARKDTP